MRTCWIIRIFTGGRGEKQSRMNETVIQKETKVTKPNSLLLIVISGEKSYLKGFRFFTTRLRGGTA